MRRKATTRRTSIARPANYRYDKEIEKHSKHTPATVKCDDCHMAQTAAGGTRYTIHDHMFDLLPA